MKHTGQYLYTLRATRPELLSEGPTDAEAPVLERHFAYLRGLAEEGVVLLAGRTQNEDPSGFGLVLFEADSTERARRVVEGDPAVEAGVMSAELFPYRVAVASARAEGLKPAEPA